MRPTWESDGVQLYLGDCLQIMPELAGVDAVVTDPPYGINIAANPFRQKFAKSAWDAESASAEQIAELRRVSRYQIIWGGNYFLLPPTRGFLVWDKQQAYEFSSAMCEAAWTNLDKTAKVYRRAAWQFEKEHPTQKPVGLMVWCLGYLPDDVACVLDPFMGSGTTGVACVQTGRKFIGVEIDPGYFEVAKKRISEAQLQMRLPLMEQNGDQ